MTLKGARRFQKEAATARNYGPRQGVARAAELPNLQLLTGSVWPYAEAAEVPLLLGEVPTSPSPQ